MPVRSPNLTLLLRTQPHLSLHSLFLRSFPLGVDHALRLLLPKGAHDAFVGDFGRLEMAIQRIAAHLGILRVRRSVCYCESRLPCLFQDNRLLTMAPKPGIQSS